MCRTHRLSSCYQHSTISRPIAFINTVQEYCSWILLDTGALWSSGLAIPLNFRVFELVCDKCTGHLPARLIQPCHNVEAQILSDQQARSEERLFFQEWQLSGRTFFKRPFIRLSKIKNHSDERCGIRKDSGQNSRPSSNLWSLSEQIVCLSSGQVWISGKQTLDSSSGGATKPIKATKKSSGSRLKRFEINQCFFFRIVMAFQQCAFRINFLLFKNFRKLFAFKFGSAALPRR